MLKKMDDCRAAFARRRFHRRVIRALALNKRGEIEVDARGQTSVPGVFAAGDVTRHGYAALNVGHDAIGSHRDNDVDQCRGGEGFEKVEGVFA